MGRWLARVDKGNPDKCEKKPERPLFTTDETDKTPLVGLVGAKPGVFRKKTLIQKVIAARDFHD